MLVLVDSSPSNAAQFANSNLQTASVFFLGVTKMLESLGPISQLSLLDLVTLTEGGKYFNLLPKALDDQTLLALAKELRLTEKMIKGEANTKPDFATTLFIVMALLNGRRSFLKKNSRSLKISESVLFTCIQVLQLGVEREIVWRLVGVRAEDHEQSWLKAFDEFAVAGA